MHPEARHLPLSAGLLAILLAGAVVAAYHYPIHVRHQTKVALVSVVYYLLAVLVPPPLAALAAGLGALGGEVSRRRASGAYPSDIASEVGRRLLMVLAAGLLAHAGGGAGAPSAVGLLGAALALGLLDALSLPLVLGPIAGEPPRQVLVASVRETALPEALQYAVGLVGAEAALREMWTLGFLVVPCAVVYVAWQDPERDAGWHAPAPGEHGRRRGPARPLHRRALPAGHGVQRGHPARAGAARPGGGPDRHRRARP